MNRAEPCIYRFFNDLLSNGGLRNGPHVLRAFYDGDTYAALPLYFQFLDEVVRYPSIETIVLSF